jgi:hypothetical protein
MLSFRRWRGRESELEVQLRATRVEPRDEFVSDLSRRVASTSGAQTANTVRSWSRVAFAGAVTTLMLGMFASFGGIGYAASGADHTYQTVKTLVVQHRVTVRHSAAADEYGKTPPTPSSPSGTVAGTQTAGGVEAAAQGGTLPFTGFSLLATVLVSLALIATGIVLRRRERTNS